MALWDGDSSGRTTSVTGPTGTTGFACDDESRLTSVVGANGTTQHRDNGMDALVGSSGTHGAGSYHRDGVGVTDPVLHDGVSSMTPSISLRTGSARQWRWLIGPGEEVVDALSHGALAEHHDCYRR